MSKPTDKQPRRPLLPLSLSPRRRHSLHRRYRQAYEQPQRSISHVATRATLVEGDYVPRKGTLQLLGCWAGKVGYAE